MELAPTTKTTKRITALITALALVMTPTISVMAQSRAKLDRPSPAQAIDRVNKLMPNLDSPELQEMWEKMSVGRNRILKYAGPSRAALIDTNNIVELLRNGAEARRFALMLANDKDEAVARRGNRFLTWLDIASAKSREERHEKIRKLQVSVIETKTSDGRNQKDFVIRGKVVHRVFAAASPSEHASGPSVLNCYDDQPEPCLTPEEQDDYIIFLAAAADEAASMQSELDSEWAEYEAYCNNFGCEDEGQAAGPSEHSVALSGCLSDALVATAGGAVVAWEIIDGIAGVGGAVAHSVLVSTAHAVAVSGAITVGTLVFAYGLYNFIQCKRAKVRIPHISVSDRLRRPFGSVLLSSPSFF